MCIRDRGLKTKIDVNDRLAFTFRGAWVHEYCDNRSVAKANFVGANTHFDAVGLNPSNDSGVFGAGIIGNINNNLSVGINYDFEVKDDYDAHNVGAVITVSF